MLNTAKDLIRGMKKYFNNNNSSNMQLNYSKDNLEKKKQIETLDYLEEKGLIKLTANASGFVCIKLTLYFIDNIDTV